MVKCDECGKETYMPFRCRYCGGYYCEEHRLPEFHNCTGLYQNKQSKRGYTETTETVSGVGTRRFGGRSRFWFSETELKNLGIGLLVIILIPLVWLRRQLFGSPLITLGAVAIFAVAFLLHELAHKFTAQRYGYWAEFRLNQLGLMITLLSFLSPFKVVAPGAVVISGLMYRDDYGKISVAGPAANIAQAIVYLALSLLNINSVISFLCYIGMMINSSLALFNLIPFGIFDGAKIMSWNRKIWLLTALAAGSIYLYTIL
ncbi:MAG: AN1-type zinc finger domain-containing protein [Candidatus Bathyarchaeia archaeon]